MVSRYSERFWTKLIDESEYSGRRGHICFLVVSGRTYRAAIEPLSPSVEDVLRESRPAESHPLG
jgi:hypothetical protein